MLAATTKKAKKVCPLYGKCTFNDAKRCKARERLGDGCPWNRIGTPKEVPTFFWGENVDYEYCEHEDHEELWEYEEVDKEHKIWQRTCLKCGEVEEEILVVEYWPDKFITIGRKQYRALKAWGNISLCSECGEVVWHPLILWDSKDTSKAVTFHFRCAETLGILDAIVKGDRERAKPSEQ